MQRDQDLEESSHVGHSFGPGWTAQAVCQVGSHIIPICPVPYRFLDLLDSQANSNLLIAGSKHKCKCKSQACNGSRKTNTLGKHNRNF